MVTALTAELPTSIWSATNQSNQGIATCQMAMVAFFHMLQHDYENEELHTEHNKKIKRNIKPKSLEHNSLKIITLICSFHSLHELLSTHSLKEKYLIQQTAVVHSGM